MPYLKSRMKRSGGWDRFDRAFINNPTCCPSRATILTGQWSHHTGVETTGGAPKFPDVDTIATRLHGAGYRTGFVGKYHLGNAAGKGSPTYIPPGWDYFIDHKADSKPYYDYTLNDNGTLVPYGSAPQDYSTDVLRDKALAFLNGNTGAQPFLLVFAPRAPHDNYTAAPRDVGHYAHAPVVHKPDFNEPDMSDKPAWWRNVPPRKAQSADGARRKAWDTGLALDDAVKAVDRKLRETRLSANTVVMYMTDNAVAFGEHRWGNKRCLYEECVRTPLLVKFGDTRGHHRFPQVVGNEDLAATFADLAGTSPPDHGDGQSFAPMLRTGKTPAGWNDEVLLRSANPTKDPKQPPNAWGIRTRRFKYIETVDSGEVELYDLRKDPYELSNVANQPKYAAIQSQLAARLAALHG
jgi:arylsulfatase A-like enzyme